MFMHVNHSICDLGQVCGNKSFFKKFFRNFNIFFYLFNIFMLFIHLFNLPSYFQ